MKSKFTNLSRRDFLRLSGISSLSMALSACGLKLNPTESPTNTPAPMYTLQSTPSSTLKSTLTNTPIPNPSSTSACMDLRSLYPLPQVKGLRYKVTVPDTLDIQYRANLVLMTMTNCTDKTTYAPYDNMDIYRNPPILRGTTMINGKYVEATSLLRYLTGSEVNQNIDQVWRNAYLDSFSNYPWWGVDPGRMLAYLGNSYRIEQNQCWLELGKQIVKRADREAIHQQDFCYFPDLQGNMPMGWEATYGGWTLQGMTQLYRSTQNSEALELAGKLARFLKDNSMIFDRDGHFLARHPSNNGLALHFHHNGNVLEGLSAYALAANDQEYAAFARSSYEWARASGSPLVGFFPEYINDWPDDRTIIDCETCCTADMIQIAMTLTEAGQGDYWDDVDRYVRNQFAEMQLLDNQWIDQMVALLPSTPLEANENGDHISEKLIGSFASWATADDWYIQGQPGTTFCCIGNGARALYYVWEKMLVFKNDTLTINLLLNRASIWADVDSFVPYEGQVNVKIKTSCNLEIRIPEWVEPKDVSIFLNGTQRRITFRQRYAQVGYVESGDLATMNFPINERDCQTTIGNIPYTMVIKGNDVVSISPQGKWYPFYQRAKYRDNHVHWIDQERFVAEI